MQYRPSLNSNERWSKPPCGPVGSCYSVRTCLTLRTATSPSKYWPLFLAGERVHVDYVAAARRADRRARGRVCCRYAVKDSAAPVRRTREDYIIPRPLRADRGETHNNNNNNNNARTLHARSCVCVCVYCFTRARRFVGGVCERVMSLRVRECVCVSRMEVG